jgi:hypothetical protein
MHTEWLSDQSVILLLWDIQLTMQVLTDKKYPKFAIESSVADMSPSG